MWFQEDIRADDWVLVDLRPVKARSARGAYHGSLRDRHGRLGATLYQEQLLLPGSAADMVRAEAEQIELAHADAVIPVDTEELRQAQDQHPAGG